MAERKDPIASIQFLRAFAALGVVVMHNFYFFDFFAKNYGAASPALETWYHFKTIGGAGVDVFFVISGFIMAHIASLNPNQRASTFFGRRLSRIVPIYWVVTAFWLWWDPNKEPLYVIKSFLFFPVKEIMPLAGVGWTLNYEMFFYVLFGLIVVLLRRSFLWIAAVFVGFSVLSMFSKSYIVHFYANPIVWNFFAGMLIQRIYRHRLVMEFSPIIFAAAIAWLLFSMVDYLPGGGWDPRTILHWGPPSALLVLGFASTEAAGLLRRLYDNRLVQEIGASSYSLYLIHNILFCWVSGQIVGFFRPHTPLAANFVLLAMVGVSCIFAFASYRAIELPAQQLLRYGWKSVVRPKSTRAI